MANVSVAAEWQLLYNRYYRKPEIYPMQWKHIDLSRNKVASAPLGRPIAVIRDNSKIKHPGGRLVGMAWTDDQTLICVVQDGTIFRYNVHAELQEPNISMGKECFEQNVVECVFWGNGMVCITEAHQIFCISDFKNPNPCKLADPNLDEYPLCVAVFEPQYTMSGNVEVLLWVNDLVLLVKEDGVQQLGVGVGPLQKLVVSQNGKLLASFTHDGRLLVISTDFSKIIFEYSSESALPPDQLAWCGMDSVLLYWDDMLLMVEYDGVRILSNTSMEFLQQVPDSTVSIFKIGSTLPAALLYDVLDHFDRRSAKAVAARIHAAGHEFDVSRQQTLLRAPSYGQAFCRDSYVDRHLTLLIKGTDQISLTFVLVLDPQLDPILIIDMHSHPYTKYEVEQYILKLSTRASLSDNHYTSSLCTTKFFEFHLDKHRANLKLPAKLFQGNGGSYPLRRILVVSRIREWYKPVRHQCDSDLPHLICLHGIIPLPMDSAIVHACFQLNNDKIQLIKMNTRKWIQILSLMILQIYSLLQDDRKWKPTRGVSINGHQETKIYGDIKVSVNSNLEADSCKQKKKPYLNQRLYVDRLHPLLENDKLDLKMI
ncbi:hypothetical protein PVL29_007144 [Vitis rotundifolia]|uniref:Vps16 N-terminal domain-containing protein n=1 Tax=Vitis rotundifolia TaxID=103349 RepID=A0AA38ZYW9_VITRO|nr:hypothetical protein PVL29_007144 [Vitis rotundifolia]